MLGVQKYFGRFFLLLVGLFLLADSLTQIRAAEVMPPKPTRYFNDYAHKVSSATAEQLNAKLENFERETSSQIVVAVFPKMQSDSSLEDYAQRIYQSWGIGQKSTNNGALLLVFIEDRKMRIQTGYGLEGALPDALCKRIIEDEIKPHFQQGDFDGGLTAGVNAILLATKGEYKGSGRTVNDRNGQSGISLFWWIFGLFIILSIIRSMGRRNRGMMYNRRGRSTIGGWPVVWGSSSGWGGGSSGWGGGGGGGGFSGGGGMSGGGGASGGW